MRINMTFWIADGRIPIQKFAHLQTGKFLFLVMFSILKSYSKNSLCTSPGSPHHGCLSQIGDVEHSAPFPSYSKKGYEGEMKMTVIITS
jgi:hypothetical protein